MTSAALPLAVGMQSNAASARTFWRTVPGWVYLAAGAIALPLASLKWNLAPVAWVAPVPFLLFMRTNAMRWSGRLWLLLALMIGANVMMLKILTDPMPWVMVPGYGVPIALVLWCVYLTADAIRRHAGDRWGLYAFPAAYALAEVGGYRLTEFGVWGAMANTQVDDLRLLQLASFVGVSGIGFLMTWMASAVALLIATREVRRFRRHMIVLAVSLATVYAVGSLRLFSEQTGETVQLAGIVADLGPSAAGLPDSASTARNTEELFARTELAARRGARIVVWNEAATVVTAAEESTFVRRGVEVAQRNGIDLVLAYIVPLENSAFRMENKYVWLSQDGEILETYHKHHPVPGEGSVPGTDPLRMLQRPYANVAGAICYDYDFPAMALGHSQLGAGLVVVPASDWRGIDPFHTQMARIRAIEGGFSVFRPVRWATSGAFDAYGRQRASLSHFETNDRIMMATLPVQPVATLYATIGDFPAAIYAFVLLVAIIHGRRARQRTTATTPPALHAP